MSIDVPFPSEMTESVPVALPQRRQRMAGAPAANGLYDPRFEHDACGVSFVVDMHGRRTHNLVQLALESLCNLDHRGAKGSEENTGDGAGILLQVPHEFFEAVCPGWHRGSGGARQLRRRARLSASTGRGGR